MSNGPIRILIVGVPRLLRELIERAISAEPDLEVIATDRLADLSETADRERAEFAIVALEDRELPPEGREFLDRRARVKLLGIGPADGHATLYRLRPEHLALGEVAPQDVVAAIRAEAARP